MSTPPPSVTAKSVALESNVTVCVPPVIGVWVFASKRLFAPPTSACTNGSTRPLLRNFSFSPPMK